MKSKYTWAMGASFLLGLASVAALGSDGSRSDLALARVGFDLFAALTVGGLLSAALLLPSGRAGVVSQSGRAELRYAGFAALGWFAFGILEAMLTLADTLGVGFATLLHRGVLGTYLWSIPASKALVTAALIALAIAVTTMLTSSTGVALLTGMGALIAVSLPVVASHGAGHAMHALALTAGILHTLTAIVWLGLALVTGRQFAAGSPDSRSATLVLRKASPWLALALAASGIATAWTRLTSPLQLFDTRYGHLILVSVVLLVAVAALVRTRVHSLMLQAALLTAALAPMVFLNGTAYPRTPVVFATNAETLVGRAFPAAPNAVRLLFAAAPDPFFLLVIGITGTVYTAGVMRLHRRGDPWPPLRTVAWAAGSLALLWATCGGVAAYAPFSFSAHMLQHMSLSMVAPILLTLGAPVTLLLRATTAHHSQRRGPREWVVWALHTPVSRVISHPVYVLALYTVGLYGLYFTPLFNYLMQSHVGHVAMQVHFLIAGLLFYWVVVGVDPGPRRVPHWARLLLVMITLVIHAFFALAMMLATHPLVTGWYWLVRPPWLTDPLHDQYVGGGIAWAFGEVPTMLVLVALAVQWSRSDDRSAARGDRQAERDGDSELTAYNEQLARLARHDVR